MISHEDTKDTKMTEPKMDSIQELGAEASRLRKEVRAGEIELKEAKVIDSIIGKEVKIHALMHHRELFLDENSRHQQQIGHDGGE